jgi:hypothetical protein
MFVYCSLYYCSLLYVCVCNIHPLEPCSLSVPNSGQQVLHVNTVGLLSADWSVMTKRQAKQLGLYKAMHTHYGYVKSLYFIWLVVGFVGKRKQKFSFLVSER